MATSQGYRIQALNIASAWHKQGLYLGDPLMELAEEIYKFITKDLAPGFIANFTYGGKQFHINTDGSVDEVKATTSGN